MQLKDILDDPARRADFVRKGADLVDSEVAGKKGLSGMALRAGYAAIKGLKPGIVGAALDALLPYFLPKVQSHVDAGVRSGDLPGYFRTHAPAIADALLSVTDDKVGSSTNPVVARTYAALRGQAKQHTQEAVPGVGRILATFLT